MAEYADEGMDLKSFRTKCLSQLFFRHQKVESLPKAFYLNPKIRVFVSLVFYTRSASGFHAPQHATSVYLRQSQIAEAESVSNGRDCVTQIVASLKTLLTLERAPQQAAAEAGDEGTNSMMSDYIREQEKMVWMYSAFLK